MSALTWWQTLLLYITGSVVGTMLGYWLSQRMHDWLDARAMRSVRNIHDTRDDYEYTDSGDIVFYDPATSEPIASVTLGTDTREEATPTGVVIKAVGDSKREWRTHIYGYAPTSPQHTTPPTDAYLTTHDTEEQDGTRGDG